MKRKTIIAMLVLVALVSLLAANAGLTRAGGSEKKLYYVTVTGGIALDEFGEKIIKAEPGTPVTIMRVKDGTYWHHWESNYEGCPEDRIRFTFTMPEQNVTIDAVTANVQSAIDLDFSKMGAVEGNYNTEDHAAILMNALWLQGQDGPLSCYRGYYGNGYVYEWGMYDLDGNGTDDVMFCSKDSGKSYFSVARAPGWSLGEEYVIEVDDGYYSPIILTVTDVYADIPLPDPAKGPKEIRVVGGVAENADGKIVTEALPGELLTIVPDEREGEYVSWLICQYDGAVIPNKYMWTNRKFVMQNYSAEITVSFVDDNQVKFEDYDLRNGPVEVPDLTMFSEYTPETGYDDNGETVFYWNLDGRTGKDAAGNESGIDVIARRKDGNPDSGWVLYKADTCTVKEVGLNDSNTLRPRIIFDNIMFRTRVAVKQGYVKPALSLYSLPFYRKDKGEGEQLIEDGIVAAEMSLRPQYSVIENEEIRLYRIYTIDEFGSEVVYYERGNDRNWKPEDGFNPPDTDFTVVAEYEVYENGEWVLPDGSILFDAIPTKKPTQEVTNTPTASSAPTETATVTATAIPTASPAVSEESNVDDDGPFNPLWIILPVLAVVCVIASLVFVLRPEKTGQSPEKDQATKESKLSTRTGLPQPASEAEEAEFEIDPRTGLPKQPVRETRADDAGADRENDERQTGV